MEQTLKITNVLSDPTRYYIYQYITERHQEVTVQEVADSFEIHPNVARLHLSKLEDVNMLISETKKTGKGGRPSRQYRLSEEVIQLHFPYRDFQLLAKIALETMGTLGEAGMKALFETGKRFGEELIYQQLNTLPFTQNELSFDQKLNILKKAAALSGFYPDFNINEDETTIFFQIHNCPFKEVAIEQTDATCTMHNSFLRGMFGVLFENVELIEKDNMINGCDTCTYHAVVTK
ncbi:helix-turn-helix transcriptional regulator [Peribacillus acanthi]|uniref:helix-turn-helix transcriptional regulator n=1 Tax=Peribacillus acanthi TaxID=2171554 RepID=UPI000D3E8EA0|nr:helix-turn-helix domain-containing protein [Peribacillus acanthi]